MNRRTCLLGSLGAVLASLVGCSTSSPTIQPTGNVYKVQGTELVITADDNHGAAIYSLQWNGFEFVNSADRGREIQTAYQLDGLGEGENPTECGQTGALTQPCATKVLSASVNGKVFSSDVLPAFWNPYNGQATSSDLISKMVTVDYNGITNLIRHDVTVTIAADHVNSIFQTLFFALNGGLSNVQTLQNGVLSAPIPNIGTTPQTSLSTQIPVVVSSVDGKYAIGVFCSKNGLIYDVMSNSYGAGITAVTAGWYNQQPCPKGPYSFTFYYVVGTLADVASKLGQVIAAAPAA